jgi:hypothetical protein
MFAILAARSDKFGASSETRRNHTGSLPASPRLAFDGGRMTSQEPRDEPPRRPPPGDAHPEPGAEVPRAPGPPVDPFDPSAPKPESVPRAELKPEQEPKPDQEPKPNQAKPDQGPKPEQEHKPEQGQEPAEKAEQEHVYEGVPHHPDPFDASPYLAESPTRVDHIRTEQMRRNAEYKESQRTEAPPYRGDPIGRYSWEAPIQTKPTDVVWPFVSRIKRSRRSDWPVLVFALVVAAIVTLGCCLAGFAAFSAWNPFGG